MTTELALGDRVTALRHDIDRSPPALCAERALLVTRYFRRQADRRAPAALQRAGALAHILAGKRVRIYPGELLVGCFTSKRVGGGLYPELHGVAVMEDLFRFERRPVNPLRVDPAERRQLLLEVLPYWAPRMMAVRGRRPLDALRFLADQLRPTAHLINESGGISHLVPDYARLLLVGTSGYRRAVAARRAALPPGAPELPFLDAVDVVCDGLDTFADGYRREAEHLAGAEPDPKRRAELQQIAAACARVPREPAGSLHEALQAILFAQIALNLESLDNSVSPGRLDQILWPCYQRDLEAGRLDAAGAFELLGCFALKLCEIVPAFSDRLTRFHGGMFNGQVVVVGGTDRRGADATNPLTWLFVELMDRLRTRQPNYHARVGPGTPPALRARIAAALAGGAVSPAVYNDEVIVPLLERRGVARADALDYATVGCVEPVASGKSFFSTDAALCNLPLYLELALNGGRRFGRRRRAGAATPPAGSCRSMDELVQLLAAQIDHGVARLLEDLQAVERANARWHPTPLTSMLLDGCLEAARDASAGGARYNGSGVQGVGAIDVGDSLAAIDAVVFQGRHATLAEVVAACRADFRGAEALRARLCAAPRYGNDDAAADRWAGRVMELFAASLAGHTNTRGGSYAAGFYSVTAHEAFGAVVGALPSGRGAGRPFSSGLSPGHRADRHGPTAALLSLARLPVHVAGNGINYNLQLPPWTCAAADGSRWLGALIDGGLAAGCMQLQVNVIDPRILIEARDHPGQHPNLLVRVSGYSAYFDDLSPAMKQELIDRWAADAAPPA